jgi:type IV secretory pathway component VirB8
MSTITQAVELFNIFSETWGKEKAQSAIRDIEELIDSKKQELATKGDLREVELKLTKEIEAVKLKIEEVKSSTIKWVAGLLVAQAGVIITIVVALLK